MAPLEPAAIVETYKRIARPMMLNFLLNRQTCIASARITQEVMRTFGLHTRVIPVKLAVECQELKYAYVSGFDEAEQEHIKRTAANWRNRGQGWQGHLVLRVAHRWLIDPSIDQIESPEHGLTLGPSILVIPISPTFQIQRMHLEANAITDEGHKLRIQYFSMWDQAFRSTPAWEMDPITNLIVAEIYRAVRSAIGAKPPAREIEVRV